MKIILLYWKNIVLGIITGFIIITGLVSHIPDGMLHVVFCDVGQGDAILIIFPDGTHMLVDGGPGPKVLDCLGRHMAFWDRSLDAVMLTHPEHDHMAGVIEVFRRYSVGFFLRSRVQGVGDEFQALQRVIEDKTIRERYISQGETWTVSGVQFLALWPTDRQLASMKGAGSVLGVSTSGHLNDASIVFRMTYGNFDLLLTGDADSRVEARYVEQLAAGGFEVLKVPHHGSKTSVTHALVDRAAPKVAVVSVGKNSYGHPTKETLDMIETIGARVLRTDQRGDIEIISDGTNWHVRP